MQTIVSRAGLLEWFDANNRDLPWRRTRDPYAIWVSEVMLQQTQVSTVVPFYERWMARFPTVEALASAQDQEALSLWQGLGYYRRCRMLLAGARCVLEHGMPISAADWIRIPGVGRYTAGAIASMSAQEPVPVVDGNVERLFARLTGCDLSEGDLHKAAWAWASTLIDHARPGDWNQALMELGATVCRSREPICPSCPLSSSCVALLQGRQGELPRAKKKPETIKLQREAWVYTCEDRYGLQQIPAGEWWEGLWRFPATRQASAVHIGTVKHAVTQHRITMAVYLIELETPSLEFVWFSPEELKHLPMPTPQRRALKLALDARLTD